MGSFSETVKESTKPKEKGERVSTGADYIKLTSEHPTIIRVLDAKPVVSWSHFVPKKHSAFPNANSGKGMSFICPGISICPICEWNKQQKAKEDKPKNLLGSRKVFTFNVLDRTPVVVCPSCGAEYYESSTGFPEECSSDGCGTSLVDVEPQPRNKIQIFQKGVMVLNQFISFEEEFGDINSYDIKLDTRGTADQSNTICVPKPAVELDLEEVLGKDWQDQLYNIPERVKPMDVSNIERILGGEDYYSVFKKE